MAAANKRDLNVRGYDHDCSAQHLANIVHRNRCLPKEPRSESENIADGLRDWTPFYDPALAICGNGVIEGNEECDCGTTKFCNEINCIPETCKRKIPFYVIVSFFLKDIILKNRNEFKAGEKVKLKLSHCASVKFIFLK